MAHNLLQGKKGIIFGALDENSIAWKTAERCVQEGAQIVLTNAPIALRMGEINKLAASCNAPVIPADATYTDLDYDFYHKGLDISAMSLHRVLQTAYKLDALNEWASVVALTYIAAQRVFPDYSDMADAKSMLESISRSFGYHYGVKNKVRVNTISQSPTRTTAGSGVKGFDGFISYAEKMSPLGNATADQCADYTVMMFSDYTRMVTMQNLFHDGGFSFTGVSASVVEQMEK